MRPNFDWDGKKAAHNLAEHGVSFEEASTVFGDPLAATTIDIAHSTAGEERLITIGRSYGGRTLVVVHQELGDKIRIISARIATKHERRAYEEGK